MTVTSPETVPIYLKNLFKRNIQIFMIDTVTYRQIMVWMNLGIHKHRAHTNSTYFPKTTRNREHCKCH